MKIIANLSKDMTRVESYLKTDIASIGIWNSNNMSWVDSRSEENCLNNYFSVGDKKTEGSIISTKTGSDGNFKVVLHLNENLTPEENNLIYKQEKAILFNVTNLVCIGSPEWAGVNENHAKEVNNIDLLELPTGEYVVDTYSLLIKDPSGNPKYIQFVFCIFSKEKYKSITSEIKTRDKVLSLEYLNS